MQDLKLPRSADGGSWAVTYRPGGCELAPRGVHDLRYRTAIMISTWTELLAATVLIEEVLFGGAVGSLRVVALLGALLV